MNQDDEEMEYNIRQFMDTILEEENEEEYTDYRKYFKYDMRILSRQDGEEVLADLSKKQGLQVMVKSKHHILLFLQPVCYNVTQRMFHVQD